MSNLEEPAPAGINHSNLEKDELVERRRRLGLPETLSPQFIERCRQQAIALAAHDPAGDEIMRWIEEVYEWPEP